MLFNSLQFLLFFPIVTLVYYLMPHRFRWAWLLASSCFFYMFFIPIYILILIWTIAFDYVMARLIERSTDQRNKKLLLVFSVVSTIAVLAFFKYFNFLLGNLNGIGQFFHLNYSIPMLDIILPIGLSFHTFQSLSYVIEVYWGKQKAEKHFGIYSLYVMFFPQLVAGPIERPQNLLHQFHTKIIFNYDNISQGVRLMVWGLFKKIVVADKMALLANPIYDNISGSRGPAIIIATIAFAIQIYCDFSGYSDIARGAAKCLGIDLMKNFNLPYISRSVGEFWRRWHISLSTWFKDYVYIPLGGSRGGTFKWMRNIFITFLLSGMWHGANWTFAIWGALNGIFVIGTGLKARVMDKLGWSQTPTRLAFLWQIPITFTLICLTWVFFRAHNLHDAVTAISKIFTDIPLFINIAYLKELRGSLIGDLRVIALLIPLLYFGEYLLHVRNWKSKFASMPLLVRWGCYYALFFVILLFGEFGTQQQFIYFQF